MPNPPEPNPDFQPDSRPEETPKPLGIPPHQVPPASGAGTPAKPRDGEINWPRILERAGPYPIEAFTFVREGLNHTVERAMLQQESAHRTGMGNPDTHHVSGQQLCLGLRDFAILQYGMLAPAVLRHWNIVRTEDFGRIVYAMIEGGVMSKTADDSVEDFSSVYDFEEAFSDAHLSARIGG